MAIKALWHGGVNYASHTEEPAANMEWFDSTEAAQQALLDRENNGHWCPQRFNYVNKPATEVPTPCVKDSYMEIYDADDEDYEEYVDVITVREHADDDDFWAPAGS